MLTKLTPIVFISLFSSVFLTLNPNRPYPETVVQAQVARRENQKVRVVLPTLANVVLKKGKSKSGQLTAIDSRSRKVKIERGGNSATVISVSDIARVKFRVSSGRNSDAPIYENNDGIRISYTPRSTSYLSFDRNKIQQSDYSSWHKIPISNFKFLDSEKGLAELVLQSSINSQELRKITNAYLVEEIKFESPGNMIIKLVEK